MIPRVTIAILVTLGACASSEPLAVEPSSLRAAVTGLCDARAASQDSVQEASDIFFNESHDALHDLARQATDEEPSAAARLLEAKNVVESSLAKGDTDVEGELGALISAANDALEAVSEEPVSC